jgi:HK97 family phage major capsid protein
MDKEKKLKKKPREEELEEEEELEDEELEDEEEEEDEEEDEEVDSKAFSELVNIKMEEMLDKRVKEIINTKRGETNVVESDKEVGSYNPKGKWGKETVEFCKVLASGDQARLKTLTTSSSDTASAGYTIPTELQREVVRLVNDEYGISRNEFRYLPFAPGSAGNTRDIPVLGNSVSLAWTNEEAVKSSTEPTFSKVTQTLKKLAAIVPMTEELLEDTAIDLPGLIADLVAEAIAEEEDEQFFNGTGTPWTGIVNNANVTYVTMAAASGFADITASDFLDMQDEMPVGAGRKSAKYFLHRTILNTARKLEDDNGNPIWQSPTASAPGTIWGYPYTLVEALPSLDDNAANKGFVIFGNLKKYVVFGDKGGLKVKILTEATIHDTDGSTAINLAEQDVIAYRFVERVGYVITLPSAIVVLRTSATIS